MKIKVPTNDTGTATYCRPPISRERNTTPTKIKVSIKV
jgi:hypothetical protein